MTKVWLELQVVPGVRDTLLGTLVVVLHSIAGLVELPMESCL